MMCFADIPGSSFPTNLEKQGADRSQPGQRYWFFLCCLSPVSWNPAPTHVTTADSVVSNGAKTDSWIETLTAQTEQTKPDKTV